jgi:hypothetical protein
MSLQFGDSFRISAEDVIVIGLPTVDPLTTS